MAPVLQTDKPTIRRVIHGNRRWFGLAALLFFASAVVMYGMPQNASQLSDAVLNAQMEGLHRLVDLIMGLPPVAAALFVFVNNMVSMVQMLVLGFIAGLSPVLTLCLNGMLVGAVSAMTDLEGPALLRVLTVSILPHGVFELAAFFISGGLGLKLGYHCTFAPLPGRTRKESFKAIWREVWTLLPLVTLLVLVAGFVEVFVTGHLVERLVSMSM